MSVKQYERYVRRLSAVQQSTRRAMRTALEDDSLADLSNKDEETTPQAPNSSRMLPPFLHQATQPDTTRPAPESYLQEASFVLNPLSGRVPAPSPRKNGKMEKDGFAQDRGLQQEASPSSTTQLALASVDNSLQDALLVKDLLYVLVGIEGNYIRYHSWYEPDVLGHRLNGAEYTIDPECDASHRQMVERVLPLSSYYTSIHAFVECESGLEYGTVMHALCAAIREQLRAYEERVASVELQFLQSPNFTLQQLWLIMHPMLRIFELIHALTSAIASVTHADVLRESADQSDGSLDEVGDPELDEALERDRRTLLGLDEPVDDIVKGGEVLSMLWDRLTQLGGDPDAHALYLDLFRAASQPYARILLRWITSGQLLDPYEEFMVVEDPRVTRASLESDPTDEYWERRYMLRDERYYEQAPEERQFDEARGELIGGAKIPSFLVPWKHKILATGKYLNAIRECGIDVEDTSNGRVQALFGAQDTQVANLLAGESRQEALLMDDEAFAACMERSFQRANAALLRLLRDETDVIGRLRSLRHFFFFAQSDFLHDFLDQSAHELRKAVDPQRIRETTLLRLQSQLDLVLGSSNTVGFYDLYREDLRVDLASERAYDQLQRIAVTKGGIDQARRATKERPAGTREPAMYLLQFDVAVQFPASLVLSKKNILRWQFVHRCLLLLKMLERALTEVWCMQRLPSWRRDVTATPGGASWEAWKRRLNMLRHRMLLLVQQLLAFYTSGILEPNWRELEHQLRAAQSVDAFMKHHFDFLNTCRKECMLTDYRYLESHRRLVNTITVFAESRARFEEQYAAWLDSHTSNANGSVTPDAEFLGKIESSWRKNTTVRMQLALTQIFRDAVNLLSATDNPAAVPLAYQLQAMGLDRL